MKIIITLFPYKISSQQPWKETALSTAAYSADEWTHYWRESDVVHWLLRAQQRDDVSEREPPEDAAEIENWSYPWRLFCRDRSFAEQRMLCGQQQRQSGGRPAHHAAERQECDERWRNVFLSPWESENICRNYVCSHPKMMPNTDFAYCETHICQPRFSRPFYLCQLFSLLETSLNAKEENDKRTAMPHYYLYCKARSSVIYH